MAAADGMPLRAACEIRFGQIGLAQLRVHTLDAAAIARVLAAKVAEAPQLFARAGACVDFSALASLPSTAEARVVLEAIRGAGMLPVGMTYGSPEMEALARSLGLPVLAKFRAAYERGALPGGASAPTEAPHRASGSVGAEAPPAEAHDVIRSGAMVHAHPVRSGQQVHARERDLVVVASVGTGAEVIADGSLHVYGTLRGRALAGARGDTQARIFCTAFEAELVAIAGVFKVFEELPAGLCGKPVQVRLVDDRIDVTPLPA